MRCLIHSDQLLSREKHIPDEAKWDLVRGIIEASTNPLGSACLTLQNTTKLTVVNYTLC